MENEEKSSGNGKHAGTKNFWKFAAVNMIILLAGLSFYWLLWDWIVANADLTFLQVLVTRIVFMIQGLLGWPVEMPTPTSLFYYAPDPGFTVNIIALCVGLGEMLFFAFLVLLFRGAAWKAKAYGLVIFLPAIFLMNIGRLVILYPLAQWTGIEAMWDTHWHIWKWGMFAVLMLLFAAWYMLIARKSVEGKITKVVQNEQQTKKKDESASKQPETAEKTEPTSVPSAPQAPSA